MKKNGPWTIKSSEVKYKNPWMEVREDQVIRPDGKDGIYGVVTYGRGVSVLPLDEAGFVYLTEEFKYGSGKMGIEVVSGGIEGEEDSLVAAKRELQEEAGLKAADWKDMGVLEPFTAVVDSSVSLYLAQNLEKTESALEGTETLVMRKFKLEEAFQMVMNAEIVHGPSCVLILKAKLFLDSKGV